MASALPSWVRLAKRYATTSGERIARSAQGLQMGTCLWTGKDKVVCRANSLMCHSLFSENDSEHSGSGDRGRMMVAIQVIVTWSNALGTGDRLRRMVRSGCSGVRLIAKGFSHGELLRTLEAICTTAKAERPDLQVWLDLPGSKARLGRGMQPRHLREGEHVSLWLSHEVPPDCDALPTEFLSQHITHVRPGHRVLVADGTISLDVVDVQPTYATCALRTPDATLTPGRSMNLPDSRVHYHALTTQDRAALAACRHASVDSLCLSMVSGPTDVVEARQLLGSHNMACEIVAKIECRAGIDHLPAIASDADCLMIARGDLSIEEPLEMLGVHQARILECAGRRRADTTIAATGLVSSLSTQGAPAIAEVSDVAWLAATGVRRFLIGDSVSEANPEAAVEWVLRICQATLERTEGMANEHGVH